MTREFAISSAREVADYLKTEHGATRVLLFGSCCVESQFLPGHSDIDLYFEGIHYDRECIVAGKTLLQFSELDLDIFGAGHAPDYFRREVLQTGVVL